MKTAHNSRRQSTFPREMTSEKPSQKFRADDVSLSWLVMPLRGKFASTNQKHYSAPVSDPSSLWNFCFRFLSSHFAWKPVISTWNVGCFSGNLKAWRLQIVARLKMCVSRVDVLFFVLSELSFLSYRSVWTFSATSSSVLNLLSLNHC